MQGVLYVTLTADSMRGVLYVTLTADSMQGVLYVTLTADIMRGVLYVSLTADTIQCVLYGGELGYSGDASPHKSHQIPLDKTGSGSIMDPPARGATA